MALNENQGPHMALKFFPNLFDTEIYLGPFLDIAVRFVGNFYQVHFNASTLNMAMFYSHAE